MVGFGVSGVYTGGLNHIICLDKPSQGEVPLNNAQRWLATAQ